MTENFALHFLLDYRKIISSNLQLHQIKDTKI